MITFDYLRNHKGITVNAYLCFFQATTLETSQLGVGLHDFLHIVFQCSDTISCIHFFYSY